MKRKIVSLLILLLVILPFLLTIFDDPVQSYTNFFINGEHNPLSAIYSWSSGSYGNNVSGGVWTLFPLGIIYELLTYILKLHSGLTQFIVCGGLFVFSYTSYVKVLPKLLNGNILDSTVIRITGLFFLFNPYTVSQFSQSYLLVIPYLFFPLQILLLLKAFETKKYLKFGLILAILNAATFGINLIFAVISFLIILAVSFFKLHLEDKISKRALIYFLSSVYTFTMILCSFWIVPQIYSSLTDSANTQSVLQSEQFYNSDSSILHVLRGLGEWSFFSSQNNIPYNSFAKAYESNPLVVFSGYAILVIALSTLFLYKRDTREHKQSLFFIAFLYLLFIIIIGTYPGAPLAEIVSFVFKHVPYALAFRNTYKFASIEMLILSILLCIVLNKLFHLSRSTILKTIILSGFLIIAVANAFPFFTNQLYSKDVQISNIPAYWIKTANYVNAQPNKNLNSVFMLPNQYFDTLTWNGHMKSFERNLEDTLFKVSAIHNTCKGCGQYLTDNFLSQIYTNLNAPGTFQLLGLTGNSTIIQRNDYDYTYYGVQSPKQVKKLLKNNSNVVKDRSVGKLDIYHIKSKLVNPLFYSPTTLVASDQINNFATIAKQHNRSTGLILSSTVQENDKLTDRHSNYYQPLFGQGLTSASNQTAISKVDVPRKDTYLLNKSNTDNNYRVSYYTSKSNYYLNLQRLGNNISLKNISISKDSNPSTTVNLGNYGNSSVVVEIQNHSLLLRPNGSSHDLADFAFTPSDSSLKVYSTSTLGRNLVNNGNLEQGLWQSKVNDCAETSSKADIFMKLITGGAPNKSNALELTAKQDSACTYTPPLLHFQVGSYYFEFDSKRIKGSEPSYCVWSGKACVTYAQTSNIYNKWTSYSQAVYMDSSASNFYLYLYAQKANFSSSTDQYANVRIYHLNSPIRVMNFTLPSPGVTQQNIILASGKHNFQNKLILGSTNLIENGDFKAGLWQSSVQNCTSPIGTAGLAMKIVRDSVYGNALQLSSNGDSTACTSSSYINNFSKDTAYLATFRYKILKGSQAKLCIWNGRTCITSETLTSTDNKWHVGNELAYAKQGGQPLSVYLYAPAGVASTVLYTDIDMRQIENSFLNSYTLTNNTPQKINTASVNSFKEVNPTFYEINMKSSGLNMLDFSQSYHPDWKLYVVNKMPTNSYQKLLWNLGLWKRYAIPESRHIVMNGFANGWWFNKNDIPKGFNNSKQNYKLIAFYSPQRFVTIGVIISGLAYTLSLIYLMRPLFKSRVHFKRKIRDGSYKINK
jgi:hypothetical protein